MIAIAVIATALVTALAVGYAWHHDIAEQERRAAERDLADRDLDRHASQALAVANGAER